MSLGENEKLRATVKNSKTIKKICNNNGSYFWTTYSYDAVILFVPSVKTQVVKAMANTAIGQKIITWWGNNSYNESVRDLNFDDNSIKLTNIKIQIIQKNILILYCLV